MASTAEAKQYQNPVIVIPVFDEYRFILINWFERTNTRATKRVLSEMVSTAQELRRVKRSLRHAKLAEFLDQAALALRAEEIEGARYILLTALAAFGWPSDLAG